MPRRVFGGCFVNKQSENGDLYSVYVMMTHSRVFVCRLSETAVSCYLGWSK